MPKPIQKHLFLNLMGKKEGNNHHTPVAVLQATNRWR